jgi:7-cyano-7-deazaguanine synthase
MTMKRGSGVLVASGGIDSTVLMYELAKKGKLAEVFVCDYGQAAARRQINLLKYHTKKLGVPLFVQKVAYPKYLMRDEIGKPGFVPHVETTMENLAAMNGKGLTSFLKDEHVYLDGRNAFFMLHAALRATYWGVKYIYTGYQYDKHHWDKDEVKDFWGDVSTQFVDAMNELFRISFMHNVEIACPFLDRQFDKTDIVALGRKLGVDLDKTYSCDFYPACGKCVTCMQAKRVGIHQTPRHKEAE